MRSEQITACVPVHTPEILRKAAIIQTEKQPMRKFKPHRLFSLQAEILLRKNHYFAAASCF